MTFLISLRWQVRLALVRAKARIFVRWERAMSAFAVPLGKDPLDWFERFVDRLSPWIEGKGYAHVWRRRLLYKLRFPRWYLRRWLWSTAYTIVDRLAPYTGPGRLEGNDPETRLKVGWLDEHNEYADSFAGGGDYPLSQYLFADMPVPWSRQPEHWIVKYDEQGFVMGEQLDSATDAKVAFAGFESQVAAFYVQAIAQNDALWPDDDNEEG